MDLQPSQSPEGSGATAWHSLQSLKGCTLTCLCCCHLGLGLAHRDHREGCRPALASGHVVFWNQSVKSGHSASKHVWSNLTVQGQPLWAMMLECRLVLPTIHKSGCTCPVGEHLRARCGQCPGQRGSMWESVFRVTVPMPLGQVLAAPYPPTSPTFRASVPGLFYI